MLAWLNHTEEYYISYCINLRCFVVKVCPTAITVVVLAERLTKALPALFLIDEPIWHGCVDFRRGRILATKMKTLNAWVTMIL